MDRLACVNIPDLPLQQVHVRHPEWRGHPVAVAADTGPQARLTGVNREAAALGVIPGMRYAAGLSIVPHLRADAVSQTEVARLIAEVAGLLQKYSPEVEPSAGEPGVFWANASGLEGLYGAPMSWAEAILAALRSLGLHAAVAVGFSKFGTYAAARVWDGIRMFESPEVERTAALAAPLRNLHVPDDARAVLTKLGVRTVQGLLRLPREGLRRRFGPEVTRLHAFAAGDLWLPLQPRPEREDPRCDLVLDTPDDNIERLLFAIKGRLPALLAALAGRGEALAVLDVALKPEGRRPWFEAQVRCAAPTMDEVQILDLLRLRLERLALPAPIGEITLRARGVPSSPEPARLLPEHSRRDLTAGRRALARVRSALGEWAVVRARLKDRHLPEARFAWEPVDEIPLPHPVEDAPARLVRRIWVKPIPMPMAASRGDPRGAEAERRGGSGSAARWIGPYIVSGGWWVREVHRDYYFLETRRGDVLWLYYDRVRQRWFAQGRVE